MNGTNLLTLTLAAAFAVAMGSDQLQSSLAAQEFNGTTAHRGRAGFLPPPARPQFDAELPERSAQEFNGAAREDAQIQQQFDNADQQFNNAAQFADARPYLGLTFDAEYHDAAVVRSIAPAGPAEQAGIQPGDTIEAINDQHVNSYQDASSIMASMRPGEIIDIDFSRRISGRTQAVVGQHPPQESRRVDYAPATEPRAMRNILQERTFAEPLPTPPDDEELSSRFPADRDRLYWQREDEVRGDIRREQRADDRPIIILRPDRGIRSRPLLPWRRR